MYSEAHKRVLATRDGARHLAFVAGRRAPTATRASNAAFPQRKKDRRAFPCGASGDVARGALVALNANGVPWGGSRTDTAIMWAVKR